MKEEFKITRYGIVSYIYIFLHGNFSRFDCCRNYINLSHDTSIRGRARIGVRKVAGAYKIPTYVAIHGRVVIDHGHCNGVVCWWLDVSFPFFNEITGKKFQWQWETILDYLPPIDNKSPVVIGPPCRILPGNVPGQPEARAFVARESQA